VYGSPASRIANAESGNVSGHPSVTPNTATTSGGNDGGITRQILNPDGDKYDEVKFDAPGRAVGQSSTNPTTTTTSDEKDPSIARQILNPGGDKYDEMRYGPPQTTERNTIGQASTSAPISDEKDRGIARQILNPGGDKYDEMRYGPPQSAAPQASQLPKSREAALDSRMGDVKEDRSVKRQVL